MLKRPEPLNPGDLVALTAPSSPVPQSVLEESIASIKFLGLEPIVMPSCHMSHGYLSGPDRQRADDINHAFADPAVKGIFCLRGGFGATRLLPLLDYPMIRKNPKAFIGFSDITALHTAFNQLCGFITFHGPMPSIGYSHMDAYSLNSLQKNLFSSRLPGTVMNPANEPLEIICPGKTQGVITGGNLSLLLSTLGSPYEVDTKDKILFLEDVGERPYRLDKGFTALSLAGKFHDCAGIVLGTFTECEEPDADTAPPNARITSSALTFHQIIDEVIRPWGKPTIANFRAGHIYPQCTIPLGMEVFFDTASHGVSFGQFI